MYSNDILTTTFAAKNININECSGECCTINNSYLWISAFWHWWASTKDKHKNKWKKNNKTSYYLLFISQLCSFLLLVSKQVILCMATERQENPTRVETTD